MLYPRGICLFHPFLPSPPFTKLAHTQALHLKSRADGRGEGGVGEEEERSLALLAPVVDFLPLFPTKKPGPRLAQNVNAQRLVWIAHKN